MSLASPPRRLYGLLPDQTPVHAYLLSAPGAPQVTILDQGATINSIQLTPGDTASEVAVGFRTLAERALVRESYFGAIIGRYANRLSNGRFRIGNTTYQAERNEGRHTLHGGPHGFDQQVWSVRDHHSDSITLELTSPNGDQGFPGSLHAEAIYRLVDHGVRLDLSATSTTDTPCQLTSHLYVNLNGGGTITDHELSIPATHYIPVDAQSIPLGLREPVDNTVFDLHRPTRLGDIITSGHPQISQAKGLDHSFEVPGEGLRHVATLSSPQTNRTMHLATDAPAVQIYTGNALDGTATSLTGDPLARHHALALEPQIHPDAPNQPWPDGAILTAGTPWHRTIEWRFTSPRS